MQIEYINFILTTQNHWFTVLAILVPIVAILVIVAIVCFLYCSRKLRQRNRRFKNLSAYGPVAVIGGTLDRKAMLETSSESSDPQHRSSHYAVCVHVMLTVLFNYN